ncbi:MAG: FAD-binding protein [Pseudomonadota bacterium]|nr:MAG: FAD-binding protein [Pseudomonadota bacterium]
MRTLVVAEHDSTTLTRGARSAVGAAAKLGGEIDVLVAGWQCQAAAEAAARLAGVRRVLFADAEHYAHDLAEELAQLVAQLAPDYTHVLTGATVYGRNFLPRTAALLDVTPLSDVVEIQSSERFVRPMYAGNVLATVIMRDATKLLTVRVTAFEEAQAGGGAPIDRVNVPAPRALSALVERIPTVADRPDLRTASIVVGAGRGVASADGMKLVETLADRLGAAIGATRAAVDTGLAPNDWQVGQTGKVVAPTLYLAVGLSGAIQHVAGMSGSKIIVAINRDPDATIFEIADYGLVSDLFTALPELIAVLDR